MTRRLLIGFSFLLCVFSQVSSAQDMATYREKFTEGNYLIIEENFTQALKNFLEAYAIDSTNANINYKLGYCYMKSSTEKYKATHYLEKACQNVSHNYTDLEPREKKAPDNAYYFLGQAYHLNYRFDEAIENFTKFKEIIGPKNKEFNRDIDRRIEICKNGKEFYSVPTKVDIINLGDSINTTYPEYSPVVTADENMLIFTSRRPGSTGGEMGPDGLYYEDIYVSYKKPDGTWTEAKSIGPNVNTGGNEASISLTADGQQLFIYKDDNGGDIYLSHLDGDSWSYPEPLGGDINSKTWETHACMTADGSTLYFVSDRAGGFGGRDIYKCVKLPNGKWSKATNLGPTINTEYDEDSPFIHPNKVDLFFSSRGHKTMGGFDIFFSTLNPDSNKWSEPMNIGYPINTTDDDIFYVATPDGKRAYYSSARPGGFGDKDIYMIKFQDSAPAEKAVALIKGIVSSADGAEIPLDILITATDSSTLEQVSNTKPIHRTGSYSMILETGKTYYLNYLVNGKVMSSDTIRIPVGANYTQYDRPLLLNGIILKKTSPEDVVKTTPKDSSLVKVTPVKVIPHTDKDHVGAPKKQVTYNNGPEFRIYFSYNVHNVELTNPDFVKYMDSLQAVVLKGNVKLLITGSASQVPTPLFNGNKGLANQRAADMKDIIIQVMKARNMDLAKVEFVTPPVALIQGPPYQADAEKNKAQFEKYQYVSVKYISK